MFMSLFRKQMTRLTGIPLPVFHLIVVMCYNIHTDVIRLDYNFSVSYGISKKVNVLYDYEFVVLGLGVS